MADIVINSGGTSDAPVSVSDSENKEALETDKSKIVEELADKVADATVTASEETSDKITDELEEQSAWQAEHFTALANGQKEIASHLLQMMEVLREVAVTLTKAAELTPEHSKPPEVTEAVEIREETPEEIPAPEAEKEENRAPRKGRKIIV